MKVAYIVMSKCDSKANLVHLLRELEHLLVTVTIATVTIATL